MPLLTNETHRVYISAQQALALDQNRRLHAALAEAQTGRVVLVPVYEGELAGSPYEMVERNRELVQKLQRIIRG